MIWLVILYSKTNPRLCAFYSWTNKAKGNIYILASSLHPPKFNPIHICYLDTGSMCTVLAVRCVEMDSASHQEHYVLMGTWWNIILDPVEEKLLISNSHFCFSTFPSKQKGGQLKRKAPRHWCKLSIRPDGILPTRCGLLLGGGGSPECLGGGWLPNNVKNGSSSYESRAEKNPLILYDILLL